MARPGADRDPRPGGHREGGVLEEQVRAIKESVDRIETKLDAPSPAR
jgi:hypothetical protein